MSLKIVSLHAENFKRLRAVEVTPEGNVVSIAGNNGEGKTSLLDAIWVALVGRSAAPPEPIRKGEEVCLLELDLGRLRITRKFTRKDDGDYTDTLKVEDPDGLKFPSPQKVLDGLLGHIGFDPFAFVQMKPAAQAKELLAIAPLEVDLPELAAKDKRAYDTRRDVNRDVKRLEGQLAGMPGGTLKPVPDVAAIREQLASADENNGLIERRKAQREQFAEATERERHALAKVRESIEQLQKEEERIAQDIADRENRIAEADPLPEPIDTAALLAKLDEARTAEEHNRTVNARAAVQAERDQLAKRSEELTAMLEASAKLRADALAKAKMPVEGLSIVVDDDGQRVTFNDVPFEQASMAEKLRVSTAIAMAGNPELRVLRILDGALLDDNSMKLLADMAAEHDFQLWIERVGTGETGIILEDGAIVGQEIEPRAKAEPKKPKPAPVDISEAERKLAAQQGADPETGEVPPKATVDVAAEEVASLMATKSPPPNLFAEPEYTPEEWAALTPARRAFLTKQGKGPTNG